MLIYRPHQVSKPSASAINEIIHNSVAHIKPAIFTPNQAPFANACRAFAGRSLLSSSGTTTLPAVSVSPSVSGHRSFDVASDAGILITHEETSACELTPMLMNETSTEPAIVANPEHIT